MKAIILAGGRGTRLQPLTNNTPKPMLDVAGKPHLLYQIELLKQYGVEEVILSLGYKAEAIMDYFKDGSMFGVQIHYVTEDTPLGTAGALKNCEGLLEDDEQVIVMNGDILTDINLDKLLRFHSESKSKITLSLVGVDNPSQYGVVVTSPLGYVKEFVEKPKYPESNFINAGIYIIDSSIIKELKKDTFLMLERDVFPIYSNLGKVFGVKYSDSYWLDIGTPDKYIKAYKDIHKGLISVNRQCKNNPIKFGTDGWRAIIGEEFTVDNCKRVAYGIAGYLQELNKKATDVFIGYDTRLYGKEMALEIAKVLSHNTNINPYISSEPIPTPGVSWAVRYKKFDLGIMITASHNSWEYNGIKIKMADGCSAPKEVTDKIEKYINESFSVENLTKGLSGYSYVKTDMIQPYTEFLMQSVDYNLIKNYFRDKIPPLHYGMNGVTDLLLPLTYTEVICDSVDVPPEPIERNLEHTKELCQKLNRMCIVNDGDGDRVGAIDELGNYVSAHEVFGLLLTHLLNKNLLNMGKDKVIKTISTGNLITTIAKKNNLKLIEVPIGYKNISNLFDSRTLIGGEESGGFGFGFSVPDRDGIMSGLLILEMMAQQQKPLHQLITELRIKYGQTFYRREDLQLNKKLSTKDLTEAVKKSNINYDGINTIDGVKLYYNNSGWLLLRSSGTEGVVRVYAEGNSDIHVEELINAGKNILKNI